MFKKLLAIFLIFCVLPLGAEVGIVSVTDENKHTQKEDFWHTFEYYIIPHGGRTGKCQATRIGKNWFATAAHCVATRCKNGCTLRMDLLEQPVSVFVDAKHTAKKPIVFVYPGYNAKSMKSIAHDFALLHIDVAQVPAKYYRRPTGADAQNVEISRRNFQKFLQTHPAAQREFNRALRPDLPPILVFDNDTQRIDRTLSVVSIFEGKRNILHNPNPADYVSELGFAYTKNFGVTRGMSGSGVMTNTGELAGIISAYLIVSTGSGKQRKQYFMFPVFNKDLTDFMAGVMGSDYDKLDLKDAHPNYVTRSPAGHSEIIRAVQHSLVIK